MILVKEEGDHHHRLEEVEEFKNTWRGDDKQYEDISGLPAPDEVKDEEAEARGWEAS